MRLIDAEPLEEILRSRCAQCSNDYGSLAGAISGCLKLLQVQPTISPPPNESLTLDDLLEMDGEPVWVCNLDGANGVWGLVDREYQMIRLHGGGLAVWENNNKTWRAYHCKPEGSR